MDKYKKLLAVLIVIAIIVTFVPKNPVHADALTAGMLGSIAYSVANAVGMNFAFTNGTAAGATNWMTGQMEQYASGQGMSVVDFFGTDAVLQGTTVLVVGKYTYDKIADFLNNLKQKYDLTDVMKSIYGGDVYGLEVGGKNQASTEVSATGISVIPVNPGSYGYYNMDVYLNGTKVGQLIQAYGWMFDGTWTIRDNGTSTYVVGYLYDSNGTMKGTREVKLSSSPGVTNKIDMGLGGNYLEPQPLPQGKQWEGDFAGTPGFAEPPTDLPDFLSRIPAAVADNQLVVTEEITEAGGGGDLPPLPTPTPRPDPGEVSDITIAQKIAAILGEILGLIGLTGDTPLTEEQQQQIADTAQNIEDSVKDVTQNITDTITQQRTETSYDIQEQTQTLTDGQTEIKDAIQDQTQTLTDTQTEIKDAIQDQTQTLTDGQTEIKDAIQDQTKEIEETKDAIKDATQVPTDFEPQKHPLPRGVFPFCIPFDLHDIIVALDAEPVTPEVHIPFRVPTIMGINFGLDYTFDLDLHDFDGLAQVLRTLEFIAFGVGLLFVTGKVIKW